MYRLKLSLVLLLLVQQFSVVHSKSIHSPKFLLQDEDLQDENAQGQEEVMIPNERLEDLGEFVCMQHAWIASNALRQCGYYCIYNNYTNHIPYLHACIVSADRLDSSNDAIWHILQT